MGIGGAILDIRDRMMATPAFYGDISGENASDLKTAPEGKISLALRNSPRHALVVDDEPLIRWSVAESLSDLGFDVEQASDASSALRSVTTATEAFDTVILDLRLPDMQDLSLLGTLRQLMPAAVLVLMTAFGTPEIIADAESLGAIVINKPFELDALMQLVT